MVPVTSATGSDPRKQKNYNGRNRCFARVLNDRFT